MRFQQRETFDVLQRMNSDAIYLILEGRAEEALQHLARCAESVRKVLPIAKSVPTADLQMLGGKGNLNLSAVSLDEVLYPFDYSERVSPDNFFRLHRFVYLVDGTACSPDLDAFQKLLATVLYNMAVVSHESVHGGIYPHILEKTRTFYELALSMIQQRKNDESFNTLQLQLALYNNLGHIYGFFFNRDGAMFCRDSLDNILTQAQHSNQSCDAHRIFRRVAPVLARNHMSKAPAA